MAPPVITIQAATPASLRADEEFWRLYQASFASPERESEDVILRSIERGLGFVLSARTEGRTVGLATGQVLEAPAATFLIYLAVEPAWRSKHLGRALFEAADRFGASLLADQGRKATGIVWEIDDPDADIEASELEVRRKRRHFFENLGGRALAVPYLQPPVDGTTEVPMLLMFRPCQEMPQPEADEVHTLIRAMYFEKYHAINEIPLATINRMAARGTGSET